MRNTHSPLLPLTSLLVVSLFALGCVESNSARRGGLFSPSIDANQSALNTPATPGIVYEYYPNDEVYYDPDRKIYYWHASAYWGVGKRLPSTYHLDENKRIFVSLDSKMPYRRHEQVLASIANPSSNQAQSMIVSVDANRD